MGDIVHHPERRLVILRPRGRIDLQACRDLAARMDELEGDDRHDHFVDLTAVSRFDLSFDQVRALAERRSERWSGGTPTRCVFCAPSDVAYGIARMFQALLDAEAVTVAVFREMPEAASWLGIPVRILGHEAGA